MKTGIIILAVLVVAIIIFVNKKSSNNKPLIQIAKQININELNDVMTQLTKKELEHDFFGITSNGIDCIYFVNTNGNIDIEFEVMTSEQKQYLESLTNFAQNKNIKISQTTYGNKPHYKDVKEAPVYKIELNSGKERATIIGKEIMETIFLNSDSTKYDVVP